MHVVNENATEAIDFFIAFREYLMANPEAFKRYHDLKKSNVQKKDGGFNSVGQYSVNKTNDLLEIRKDAIEWHKKTKN
jgi:GrpB-like predicted nucleotidyltransferase (UPF0157 family)